MAVPTLTTVGKFWVAADAAFAQKRRCDVSTSSALPTTYREFGSYAISVHSKRWSD